MTTDSKPHSGLDVDAIRRRWSTNHDRGAHDYTDEGCRVLAEHAFADVNELLEQLEAQERDVVEFCRVLQLTAPKSCQSWIRKMTAARLAKVSIPASEPEAS